ncbi:MAG: hypothetical protein ABR924_05300, partial [Terracidiphilus sp.]
AASDQIKPQMLYPIYPQPNGSGFSANVKCEFCNPQPMQKRESAALWRWHQGRGTLDCLWNVFWMYDLQTGSSWLINVPTRLRRPIRYSQPPQ